MAAGATVTLTTAVGNLQPRTHIGLTPVDITTELATTQTDHVDDNTNLFLFPDVAHLWSPIYVDIDDLDTGAGLQWDLVVEDTDGTNSVTLISNSTAGQAAGTDLSDDEQADLLRDVSGKYLRIEIDVVGATPVAGTFRVRFAYFAGFGGQLTGTAT
jgi:hypothetical protein